MALSDRFADIAASGMNTQNKGLFAVRGEKAKAPKLPFGEQVDESVFCTERSPEQSLELQLQTLRTQYAPFCRHVAPPLTAVKERRDLVSFQWRRATAEDQKNFASVLSGAGEWETVQIPHYGGPLGKAETIYRTVFSWQGTSFRKAVFLHFDGVDYIAHVFLNGKLLGSHEGFFAPFAFDCTENLVTGENVLVVCVENDFTLDGSFTENDPNLHTGDKIYAATGPGWDDPQFGWHHCPPGMGIYQPVWLEVRPRRFLDDLFVRPLCGENCAELHIDAYNCDAGEEPVSFRISVFGSNFEQIVMRDQAFVPRTGQAVGLGDTFTLAMLGDSLEHPVDMPMGKGMNNYRINLPMGEYRKWTPDTPWLYEAQVQLLDAAGEVRDEAACTFGMRSFTLEEVNGKMGMPHLNGVPMRLFGANTMGFEQQDVMRDDTDRLFEDILLAKACGMNFLRLTQRPVQAAIYDMCDHLGMMTQTDLPIFGVLRRNQFAEAVRQAGEMEHLVRSHPCNILVTYINEPCPNAKNMPHRGLLREELTAFFEAADRIVHLENPDRVIKHADGDYDPPDSSLPDNHCYTCWYNGHGLDAGALHQGDWLPVKRDWLYGCGEFGAEGLDPVSVMRKYYPESWLPQSPEEEKIWTPDRIIGAQSGSFHRFFYETPHTLEEWVNRSQEHQAWATKWMTEAFRRNPDMVSFAIHLFIDAFPSGWMKAIVDVDRTPKPAYYAYRDALTPAMISLRTDRFSYFGGETAEAEVWVCSSRPEELSDLVCAYEAELPDGTRLSGTSACDITPNSATCVGLLAIPLPEVNGVAKIHCALLDGQGNILHRNNVSLSIYQRKQPAFVPSLFTPDQEGGAPQLIAELGVKQVPLEKADSILFGSYNGYVTNREEYDSLAAKGKRLVFLDLPQGEYQICGLHIHVKESSMMPAHFVSRDTGHPWVQGFDREAFRLWYDEGEERITPILDRTFQCEGMRPVLTGTNTDASGEWHIAMAVGEAQIGEGKVVLCELHLPDRVCSNPVARVFAERMLGAE